MSHTKRTRRSRRLALEGKEKADAGLHTLYAPRCLSSHVLTARTLAASLPPSYYVYDNPAALQDQFKDVCPAVEPHRCARAPVFLPPMSNTPPS